MLYAKLRQFSTGGLFWGMLIWLGSGSWACGQPTSHSSSAGQDHSRNRTEMPTQSGSPQHLRTGADQTHQWMHLIQGKKFGLVMHSATRIGGDLLYDSLVRSGLRPEILFVPEHGLFSSAEAGETIQDGKDPRYGIPVISLYGSKKEPSAQDLKDLDVLIFDLQDVGVRFYTYLSTLHYVMQACAQNGVHLIVLDRPNPNGCRIDGPVLDLKFSSFVGLHPVPILYGMSIGEYAQMIQGEGWIKSASDLVMSIIPMQGYRHDLALELPVSPSPNLPNARSVWLYPSLCLFEGTPMSVGRGTPWPFQVLGHPQWHSGAFSFTPESQNGSRPLHGNKLCKGLDLRASDTWLPGAELICADLDLGPLLKSFSGFHRDNPGLDRSKFFTPFFAKLAGTDQLQEQILQGWSQDQIKIGWQAQLDQFKRMRTRYLIYE